MNQLHRSTHEYPLDQYKICVKGHLDQRWSDWFEGFAISPTDNGETQLSGRVVDQAALYGLLIKVRDLGAAAGLGECDSGETNRTLSQANRRTPMNLQK
jgi:hypothetical protein